MYGFSVSLYGVTASFREPSSHLYQTTLPLPPISALVGLAGAAVGKSFVDAWCFFKTAGLAVGVSGHVNGSGIDLWKYRKMVTPKSEEEKETAKTLGRTKIARSDILNREFLAYPCFCVDYAFTVQTMAEDIRQSFLNPSYALSLGNSDDIAFVKNVSGIEETREEEISSFKDTLLEGDHAGGVSFDWEMIKKSSIAKTLNAPIVRRLIIDFEFDKETRRGTRYKEFTFLMGAQRLTQSQKVSVLGESNTPLYFLSEE